MNSARAADLALEVGWHVGRLLPRRAIPRLARLAGRVGARSGVVDLSAWRANVARVQGSAPTRDQESAAVELYARYFLEMLSLAGWSTGDVARACRVDATQFAALRADVDGPGAVVALGHLGNWDLAGAWACQHGLPVSAVAEELPGRAFARFVAHRERLGFTVYGHRRPDVVSSLVADARRHRLICLLADRDLRHHGLPVAWPLARGSAPVTIPAGPALVAQRSGAVLRALALRYDGAGLVFDFSAPIPVGPGPEGLAEAAQGIANHLGGAVARDVTQWHVLQPFFGPDGSENA